MTKKEVLTVSDKLYKLSADKVSEALQLSAEMADTDEVDEKLFVDFLVKQQGEVIKERHTRGYKDAEKKIKTQFEKELREEFGIETDLQGIELVRHIIEAETPEASKAKGKLTDEDVKKHPLYINLEKAKADEVKKLKDDHDKALNAEKENRNYEKLLSDIDTEALKIFEEIGEAVLPEDKAIAQKQIKKLLLEELKQGRKYQKQDDGSILVLDADGKRVEDTAGNAISFKDVVNDIAKQNFQFKAAQERQSPANSNDKDKNKQQQQQQAAKKYTGKAPANAQEYMNVLLDEKLETEVKADFKQTYSQQFSTN